MIKRLTIAVICFSLILSNLQIAVAQSALQRAGDFNIDQLPVPGTIVGVSMPFVPLSLKGLIVNPKKPLEFQFIMDTGEGVQQEQLKQQANQLVKYFLAGLTIPESDLWVNLSPYEKDRMAPAALVQTDLGRDLLAEDYILKQLTASLIYPEKDLGKEFWSRVYTKAQKQFGTTNIPVSTFNKVWILPDQAQVFENGSAAYVTRSTLKVMLDEDYLSFTRHSEGVRSTTEKSHSLASQMIREIILPEIEKEVNTGKNFAPLRQIYQALILAKWYKETVQNGLLDAVYTNKNKCSGVHLNDPQIRGKIYNRYLQAYQKGVFNYIKDVPSSNGGSVSKKYFSGGISRIEPQHVDTDGAMSAVHAVGPLESVEVNLEKFSGQFIHSAQDIADLIEALYAHHLEAKIQGEELMDLSSDPENMLKFIQRYSILKNQDDIYRILSWRLQSEAGVPLSGVSADTAKLLYNSVFDQEKLLSSLAAPQKPLKIVLFRKGSSQRLTNILKNLPNVNIKVVLSGSDDGLSWFYGARVFNATGISGAGRALLDLALNKPVERFLSSRIDGENQKDVDLENDFRGLVMKLADNTKDVVLSPEMKKLYDYAWEMDVDERVRIVSYLEAFLRQWDQKIEGQNRSGQKIDHLFTLHDVPVRSLVLVGAAQMNSGNWQQAINQIAQLLKVAPGNEVILPVIERQHLVAVREDGTIYFSETGISLHITKSPFLGLWLVDQKTCQDLLNRRSFSFNEQQVPIQKVTLGTDSPLRGSERREILETTRKIAPEAALAFSKYLAAVSTTDEVSGQKVSLAPQAKAVLDAADIILYSSGPTFETDVGGVLIVPGVGEAIRSNQHAVKINLFEVTQQQQEGDLIDYLERGYRYLTGKLLYQNRQNTWESIDRYVNYVLAGEISREDGPWLAKDLMKLEEKTEHRVDSVRVHSKEFRGQDFYSSSAVRGSLMALKGIDQAGFVISNDGGLMPKSNARQNRARAHLGVFDRDNRVSEMIREIRRNWFNIINYGAFVFDVDKTILPKGSKGLDEYKELASIFKRLLHKNVRVAIISGNSQSEVMEKIYGAIKSEMKDDLSAFKNLTFYINGGATKIAFKEDGRNPIADVQYSIAHGMDAQLIHKAINEVLVETARDNFGLSDEQTEAFIAEIKKYLGKNYPGLLYTTPWKNGGAWVPEVISEADIAEAIKEGRSIAVPWKEERGRFFEEGKHLVASLAIKPTPVFELSGQKIDIRRRIQDKIEHRLKDEGKEPENFRLRSGGSTTTDITQAGAEKPTALLDYIASNKLNPRWVFYFGDEFFIRKGKEGNDETIARDPRLQDVRTLAVNEDNIEGAYGKTLWIGRSSQGTSDFLKQALDSAMAADEYWEGKFQEGKSAVAARNFRVAWKILNEMAMSVTGARSFLTALNDEYWREKRKVGQEALASGRFGEVRQIMAEMADDISSARNYLSDLKHEYWRAKLTKGREALQVGDLNEAKNILDEMSSEMVYSATFYFELKGIYEQEELQKKSKSVSALPAQKQPALNFRSVDMFLEDLLQKVSPGTKQFVITNGDLLSNSGVLLHYEDFTVLMGRLSHRWKVELLLKDIPNQILVGRQTIRFTDWTANVVLANQAMSSAKAAVADVGGINFNRINVKSSGKKVKVQFDQLQLDILEEGGFKGFTPVIVNITPLSSPLGLLGIAMHGANKIKNTANT